MRHVLVYRIASNCITVQGGPQKQVTTKLSKIVLKPPNEIKFFRQIKLAIKHYNISWL